jgi:hypothetical protein
MVSTASATGPGLRPILTPDEYAVGIERGEIFERGGFVVRPNRRLGQLVQRKPAGITGHQWSSATRSHFDFVVCAAGSYAPLFAVGFDDPVDQPGEARRTDRMTDAVCAAVGLAVLRIESAALRLGDHRRRILDYLIDARAFLASTPDPADLPGPPDISDAPPLNYRDIVGRLPDGRSGYVNDLSAVARATAVEVYVRGQLADPIIRGLHVRWPDGMAEGWAWLEVRERLCVFERVRLWPHRFSCGVEAGQFAEDLAAAAVGERMKFSDTVEPVLHSKDRLARALRELRLRRDELAEPFAFDHVSFD